MRRRIWILLFLSAALWGQPAAAQGLGGVLSNLGQVISTLTGNPPQGVIVRTTLGAAGLQSACQQKGCTVVSDLDGGQNQVFLVRPTYKGLLPNLWPGSTPRKRNSRCGTRSTLQIPTSPTNQLSRRHLRPVFGHRTGKLLRHLSLRRLWNQPAAQISAFPSAECVQRERCWNRR